MSKAQFGISCCLLFITIEAFQAVYLGSIFQNVDSFLIGTWVFGLSVVGAILVTAICRPGELWASVRAWKLVAVLNLFAAVTWSTYFIAIQLIEPAVVFTVFSGMVPLGTIILARLGIPEAQSSNNLFVRLGNAMILLAIFVLAAITAFGLSGFARGSWAIGLAGVCLAAISGACTACVILYSFKLNDRGVGPLAQFGFRFLLYTVLAFLAFLVGIDAKDVSTPIFELLEIVLIGLVVIAYPLYLVQRAVQLVSVSTIAAFAALGPALVFAMQLIEGRVEHSSATLIGLAIYLIGAMIAVYGTTSVRRVDS